jgi:MbtH protein
VSWIVDEQDPDLYTVVVNAEEQYSVWFATRELPIGWRAVGVVGTRDQCLHWIDEHWTDMRPKRLRTRMDTVR